MMAERHARRRSGLRVGRPPLQKTRNPADSPPGELPGSLPPATAGDTSMMPHDMDGLGDLFEAAS